MPYTPVNFQDGVTPLNAATLNKLDDALEDLYTNPAAALTYEGDHVPATSYQDGDIVVKDGIAYLCVGGPTTQAPNPVPWGPAGMMSGYIKTTDKGVANGVASLDGNGRVPQPQLPFWTSYAPTFSGGTLGNSSLVGYYLQVGKIVFVRIVLTAGTTFAPGAGAQWYLGLPINRGGLGSMVESGTGWAVKQGIGYYAVFGIALGTASVQLHIPGTTSPMGGWTGTNPFTWASGDTLHFQLSYEVV